jgi:hypothetical protein
VRTTATLTCLAIALSTIALTTATAEPLGVPVCDEFLTKYEACIAKIPAQQQAAFSTSLEQMRTGWKGLAANPQTKPALEGVCRQMNESMKPAMAPFGCQW